MKTPEQKALAERLIVALDFKPEAWSTKPCQVRTQIIGFAEQLQSTGITVKVNSNLRACGLGLIKDLQDLELKVFADLKIFDIKETLATDGEFLRLLKPKIVTVSAHAGFDAIHALKDMLPETKILGVTLLTNMKEAECWRLYQTTMDNMIARLADLCLEAGADGLISSAVKNPMLRKLFGKVNLTCPAIRPAWSIVKNDDQNQALVTTPTQAFETYGADAIVVGRPITGAQDPLLAVERTLKEMEKALTPTAV